MSGRINAKEKRKIRAVERKQGSGGDSEEVAVILNRMVPQKLKGLREVRE